ncbi:hypothetical protein CDD83_5897 [Cordyceps sp. RAO-2017]|nr:hypothetical protein CDD83_5897 [Cordyceps sp. RAO-2017]
MKTGLVLAALGAVAAAQVVTPTSAPPPLPTPTPTRQDKETPRPHPAPGTPDGPICECGYTYCASVLMKMEKAWSEEQLAEAYCKTPKAACSHGAPSSDVGSALFLCLCETAEQRVGRRLQLVCGCGRCLVVGPDYRGRCDAPCHAGPACAGSVYR